MTKKTPLTKSGFLDFKSCSKSFWLRRHKLDVIQWPSPTEFDQMLMADGYAVEAQVREWVQGWDCPDELRFQQTYNSDDGLLARTDLVRLLDDGRIDLYEVKSSTSLKSQSGNHVDDAAFQVIAIERSGVEVRDVYVIHVDKAYVRDGDIDPSKLLIVVDVSDQVREMIDYVTCLTSTPMRQI